MLTSSVFQYEGDERRLQSKRSPLAFALFVAIAASPAISEGGEVFRFNGEVADASFFSTFDCLETSVFIFAADNQVKSKEIQGRGETSSEVFIDIFQFDSCTFETKLSAFGFASLEEADFVVDSRLESASLDAQVELFDFVTETSFTVDAQVDWDGTGDVENVRSHFSARSPGFFINSRFKGRSRTAEASGTVFDGTTDYTPEPAEFATIGSQSTGEVIVSH